MNFKKFKDLYKNYIQKRILAELTKLTKYETEDEAIRILNYLFGNLFGIVVRREYKDNYELKRRYKYISNATKKTERNVTKFKKVRHFFHIVDSSPWPFIISLFVSSLALSLIISMHYYINWNWFFAELGFFLFAMFLWFRDVLREAIFEGQHTTFVQKNIRFGMALFILSEVMFFFSFFWAFFHVSLSPNIELGCVWPPIAIEVFNPFAIPLLNTEILLLSGATLTWVHYCLTDKRAFKFIDSFNNNFTYLKYFFLKFIANRVRIACILGFICTLLLSFIFTGFQLLEYSEAPFNISDSVYGSTFFLMTGFHGFHVIVGTLFIIVCFKQFLVRQFTRIHHVGFECAAWYWHFVDVVWLFLYISIYWWGSWI